MLCFMFLPAIFKRIECESKRNCIKNTHLFCLTRPWLAERRPSSSEFWKPVGYDIGNLIFGMSASMREDHFHRFP